MWCASVVAKVKEGPTPMWCGPQWSQSEGGPLAHAVGAPVVPAKKAPSPKVGLGGPTRRPTHEWGSWWSQSEGGPSPMRWGPPWSQSEGGLPHPCSGGLGGPKAKEAPTPMRVGAPVVPKRRRPPPHP